MLENDDRLTLTREEKRELLRRLQQLEKIEEENRELKRENKRLNDRIRKL